LQKRALALVVATILLAGCNGGTVDRHALTNDAAAIDSMSCEGALLARDVAQGKTTATYAYEQAAALHVEASNLAHALEIRTTIPGLERKVRAKSRQAAKLSGALNRLAHHSSDRGLATAIEQELKQLGGCA
jgi:hypothetical protein